MEAGSGGFVCDSSGITLSPLVLFDSSSSTRAGCYGRDLAEASSVCLSPHHSAPGSSRESAPDGARLLLVAPFWFSDLISLLKRLSKGDSRQEGSPLTGGGHDPLPLPGVVEAVGVAVQDNCDAA